METFGGAGVSSPIPAAVRPAPLIRSPIDVLLATRTSCPALCSAWASGTLG
jgi:hypothetical protein